MRRCVPEIARARGLSRSPKGSPPAMLGLFWRAPAAPRLSAQSKRARACVRLSEPARASRSRQIRGSSDFLQEHEVVSMDDFIGDFVTQHARNLRRAQAHDF